LPENDPYNAIEALVAVDPAQIRDKADPQLAMIAEKIIAGGDLDHLRTGGNWAGNLLWFWDGTQYVDTTVKGP
jgi:hypothetical protein